MSVSKNATGSTTTRQIALQAQSSGGGAGGPVAAADVTGLGRAAQDATAAALLAGTHTGATFTYDAQNGKISLAVNVDAANVSNFAEAAQDAAAAALVAGQHTNVTVTYDDANNRINLSATGGGGGGATTAAGISDFVEAAQDAAAGALTHTDHVNITVSYNDAGNKIVLTGAKAMEWLYSGSGQSQVLRGFKGPDNKDYAVLLLDPSGNVKANIVPRTGTYDELQAFNGANGELSAATDFPAIFKHTGVPGEAAVFKQADVPYLVGPDYPGTVDVNGNIVADPNKYTAIHIISQAEPYGKLMILNGTKVGQNFTVVIDIDSGVNSLKVNFTGGEPEEQLPVDLVMPMNAKTFCMRWSGLAWVLTSIGGADSSLDRSALWEDNAVAQTNSTSDLKNTSVFGTAATVSGARGSTIIDANVTTVDEVTAVGRNVMVNDSSSATAVGNVTFTTVTNTVAFGQGHAADSGSYVTMHGISCNSGGNSYAQADGIGARAQFSGAVVRGISHLGNSNVRAQHVETVMAGTLAAATNASLDTITVAGPTRRKPRFAANSFARVDVETIVYTASFAKVATVKHRIYVKANASGVLTVVTAAAVVEAMNNSGFATAPTVTVATSGNEITVVVNAPEAGKAVAYVNAIELL